jgi:hypothetical protein
LTVQVPVFAALVTVGPYVLARGAVSFASFRETLPVTFQRRVSGTAVVFTVAVAAVLPSARIPYDEMSAVGVVVDQVTVSGPLCRRSY